MSSDSPLPVRYCLPRWAPMAAITLFGRVFAKLDINVLDLEHELVHVRQQAEHPVWFWVSYLFLLPLFWNPFRAKWEAEAYAVQARAGCPIDGDHGLAAQLASFSYGWPCRRAKAADLIRSHLSQ